MSCCQCRIPVPWSKCHRDRTCGPAAPQCPEVRGTTGLGPLLSQHLCALLCPHGTGSYALEVPALREGQAPWCLLRAKRKVIVLSPSSTGFLHTLQDLALVLALLLRHLDGPSVADGCPQFPPSYCSPRDPWLSLGQGHTCTILLHRPEGVNHGEGNWMGAWEDMSRASLSGWKHWC